MHKSRTVFNASTTDLERAEALVERGRYRSLSEFIREAMAEKLVLLDELRVAEQVERYCAQQDPGDDDLIAAQAFADPVPARARPKTAARKKKRKKSREAG